MTISPKLSTLLLVAGVLFSACGSDVRDREGYGDIATSPGGIQLINADEHKGGYGRKDCVLCHNISLNVHRGPTSPIDADELNRVFLSKGGDTTYCMSCHGANGTQ